MHSLRPSGLRISGRSVAALGLGLSVLGLLDGAFPQAQMTLTGGHVFVPSVAVKLCLLFVLGFAAAWRVKLHGQNTFIALWLITIFYVAADALFLVFFVHKSAVDLAVGLNSYYGYFLIAPMAGFLANNVRERRALLFLLAAFVLCLAVGTLQHVSGKPLFYTESIDGSFTVDADPGESGFRAFSLFTSGLNYGGFCCLICGVGIGLIFWSNQKLIGILIFTAASFGCYTTLTRNCYLQFILVAGSAICLSHRPAKRYVRYFPLLFLFVSMLVAWKAIGIDSANSGVASNVSVLIRAAAWQHYLVSYGTAPLSQKLFGLGLLQNAKAASDEVLAIDNQYLAILLNIGIIGFLLMFWLQWKMWQRLYNRAVAAPSAMTIGVAAFWSTFLAVFIFNISLAPFALVYIIALLSKPPLSFIQQRKARRLLRISLAPVQPPASGGRLENLAG
jgi:hypothetical protein